MSKKIEKLVSKVPKGVWKCVEAIVFIPIAVVLAVSIFIGFTIAGGTITNFFKDFIPVFWVVVFAACGALSALSWIYMSGETRETLIGKLKAVAVGLLPLLLLVVVYAFDEFEKLEIPPRFYSYYAYSLSFVVFALLAGLLFVRKTKEERYKGKDIKFRWVCLHYGVIIGLGLALFLSLYYIMSSISVGTNTGSDHIYERYASANVIEVKDKYNDVVTEAVAKENDIKGVNYIVALRDKNGTEDEEYRIQIDKITALSAERNENISNEGLEAFFDKYVEIRLILTERYLTDSVMIVVFLIVLYFWMIEKKRSFRNAVEGGYIQAVAKLIPVLVIFIGAGTVGFSVESWFRSAFDSYYIFGKLDLLKVLANGIESGGVLAMLMFLGSRNSQGSEKGEKSEGAV